MIPEIRSLQKQFRECIYINCWHINEYESDAMWRLYSSCDKGIAIQSTFSRLEESFKDSDNEIMIGKINYIDYEKDRIPSWNALSPFLYKRKNFEHERELRALTIDVPRRDDPLSDRKGILISTKINRLIENVYVAPFSEKSFIKRVNSIMFDHNLGKEIKPSALENEPTF